MTQRPRRRPSGSSRPRFDPSTPDLVVRAPSTLPVLVPYLVGFLPEESVVVVGLEPGSSRVVITMRLDIPPPDLDDDERADLALIWARTFAALDHAGAHEVTVVVYPGEAGSEWADVVGDDLPHRGLAAGIRAALDDLGLIVVDAVCVVGDRTRSYLCENQRCCPPGGTRIDESEELRIRAVMVERGVAPLPSRRALERALDPRPAGDPFLTGVRRARDQVIVRLPPRTQARVEGFLHDVARWGRRPAGTSTITRLVVMAALLSEEITCRDLLLRELTVECDRPTVEAARQVLTEAVRCAAGPDAAAPAAVLAVCGWLVGDGAAARVAVDRSLAADPFYSLAHLVGAALDQGIPPWDWKALMADLPVEAILDDGPAGERRSPA